MGLLETIVPSQRWGIAEVAPRGWRLFFKGGWGTGTGLVDHQVALLTAGRQRVSVAILTAANGSHAYGKRTLRGIAKRLLRGLAPDAHGAVSAPPRYLAPDGSRRAARRAGPAEGALPRGRRRSAS